MGSHANCLLQEKDTPLVAAAAQGNVDCVRLLLDAGADKNSTDKVCASVPHFRWNAILQYTFRLNILIITILCFSGAGGVSLRHSQEKRTALMSAVSCRQIDCLRLLLSFGVDLDAKDTVRVSRYINVLRLESCVVAGDSIADAVY